jgi:hypothetical protein
MGYGFGVGLQFLDPLSVCFDVIRVDLVLWGGWVERAEFWQYLDRSLILCYCDSLGAFSF